MVMGPQELKSVFVQKKLVNILVDNDSWILPYAKDLEETISSKGFSTHLARDPKDIQTGWICFLLGCINIVKDKYLSLNTHNLVVHESDLPKGRGFAPMTWQILEGKNLIPICLLDASSGSPDEGDIWIRDVITLRGSEYLPEWRDLQGKKTIELCLKFIDEYGQLKAQKQIGKPTYYNRRTPMDSEIDLKKPLGDQVNLLRVVDNENYPAFYKQGNKKYILKIEES